MLDTPEKALEVYAALRNEEQFAVELERRGATVSGKAPAAGMALDRLREIFRLP